MPLRKEEDTDLTLHYRASDWVSSVKVEPSWGVVIAVGLATVTISASIVLLLFKVGIF